MLRSLADLVAPSRCLTCGARSRPPWCERCGEAVASLQPPSPCDRCALPDGAGTEHACWPVAVPIVATVSGYRYTGAVARTVVAAKVRGAWASWEPLGRLLGGKVAVRLDRYDVVTWVPGDPRRVRSRGFDHAALLAAGVASAVSRPCVPLLTSRRRRRDQASLATAARRSLPRGVFGARHPLEGLRPLLVDDVLTTGATVRAAAGALADAGARTVRVAVLARAGRHGLS